MVFVTLVSNEYVTKNLYHIDTYLFSRVDVYSDKHSRRISEDPY